MKISAIEIGTNSTKFIIAEVLEDHRFKVLERTRAQSTVLAGTCTAANT